MVVDGMADPTPMKLSYVGRRHAFYLAIGDDARDEPAAERVDGSVPSSADLTISASDEHQPYTYPEDKRIGFTQ